MKRLIDVEDLEKFIREHRCVIGDDHLLLVAADDGRWHEALPLTKTAYDVDKVLEQLEAYSNADEAEQSGTVPIVNLVDAIEIVKAGIDTENNHDKEVYLTALEDYHRLISEECELMSVQLDPYALYLKEYNNKVLERLKAGGNY